MRSSDVGGNPLRRIQHGYTTGVRSLASRSVLGLARTRVTPNALTAAGVSLCLAAAVLVFFEYRNEILFYWLGAIVFLVGSIADVLDGALARAGGKSTPFGAFLDSSLDRVGEGAMIAGSFLVSYTRAKAELLGFRGDVGIGGRAERVVAIAAGLVFAPWGALQWFIYLLAAAAWITVVQRILHVRKQLQLRGGNDGNDERQ